MSEKNYEYAILKSEENSEIYMFIHINNSWINREIVLSYSNQELIIIINEEKFTSQILPKLVQDWLKYNPLKVYFTDDNGKIIAETFIEITSKEIYGTEN